MQIPEMINHRKAFYLGSILPDCKLSFLTQKHEFTATFDKIKEEIYRLSTDFNFVQFNTRSYMCKLGEVIHYIADYFTFPHNINYEGNFKTHCLYEKDLKFRLREYVKSDTVNCKRIEKDEFDSVESIFIYVQNAHDEYLTKKRNVDDDCSFIVEVCHRVVQAIFYLLNKAKIAGTTFQLGY